MRAKVSAASSRYEVVPQLVSESSFERTEWHLRTFVPFLPSVLLKSRIMKFNNETLYHCSLESSPGPRVLPD